MTVYTYGVYVILLDKKVLNEPDFLQRSRNHDPSLDCYYVGMSAKPPEECFCQHKYGYNPSKYVKDYGIDLVPNLYENLPRFSTGQEAIKNEKDLAEYLRDIGHAAYWNGIDHEKEVNEELDQEDEQNKMDGAARKARLDLEEFIVGLDKKNREGAQRVMCWLKENYRKAGYKRLGRIVVKLSE